MGLYGPMGGELMPIKIYRKPNRSPRTDRTFSGKDICRIWRGNLTESERQEVKDCICESRNNFEQLRAALESINLILDAIEGILRIALIVLRFGNGVRAKIAVAFIRRLLARFGTESVRDFEEFIVKVIDLIPDVEQAIEDYIPEARESINNALGELLGTN